MRRWLPERSYQAVEIAPASTTETLGTVQATTAYGTDARTSMDLVGMTANEQPEMQPPNRFFIYDQMRKEDATVKSTLWLYGLPMRSGLWQVVPGGDTPEDRVVCDAYAYNMGLNGNPGTLDVSWRDLLSQKLMKLVYGCMFAEVILGDIDLYYDADGDPHPLRPYSRFMPIWPQTIKMPDGIVTDKQTGRIAKLEQSLPNTRPVPGEKLVHDVLDREGSDWFGTAMLRPMYGAWRLKRAVMIAAGIGWDRFAFGTPVVRYPMGGGTRDKQQAEEIGRNWRAHERGYFVLEGSVDQGWDIDIKGGQQNIGDPTSLIHLYDEQIASAALQHFVILGRSAVGSRALGDALGEPYYMALQAFAEDLIQDHQRQVTRPWVDMNFGPQYDLPILTVSKLQARNISVLAASIAALADAGFSFTDPETQNDVREQLDLRTLPNAAQEALDTLDNEQEPVGLEPTGAQPPALPAQRAPVQGQTDAAGRPALSGREGDGLGY